MQKKTTLILKLTTAQKSIKQPALSYFIKAFSVCLLLAGCAVQVNAQTPDFGWAKNPGGTGRDEGWAMAADGAGNIYVAGTFGLSADFNPGGTGVPLNAVNVQDIFLAKYAPNGNCIWAKSMGGTGADYGLGVAVDGTGNVYVTGYFSNADADFNPGTGTANLIHSGGVDAFIAKYDPNGNYLWAKSMGGSGADHGKAVAADDAGNVYVTGYFNGAADFNRGGSGGSRTATGVDAFLVKFDATGTFLWVNTIEGSSTEEGRGVAVDGTGNNVYVTGTSNSAAVNFNPGGTVNGAGNYDVFLAKYNAGGTYQWAKAMGGTNADNGQGVAVDGTGNVYVTGIVRTTIVTTADFNPGGTGGTITTEGNNDVFLAKYDPSGIFQWVKNMGGSSVDNGYGISLDGTGNAYVTGYYNGTANFNLGGSDGLLTAVTGADVFVAKYDPNGNYRWAKSMGGGADDQGLAIAADGNGNVYATGYFNSHPTANFNPGGAGGTLTNHGSIGSYDVFLVKLEQGCQINITFTETACDSFVFNGVTYTATGAYADTFTSSANCDSIVTLDLTIRSTSVNPVVSGHYCDAVTFNGTTYTGTGVYVQNYTNASGCDSNITYDLTIGYSSYDSVTYTTCDSYELHGTVYTATGIYLVTITNASGCDSTIVLDLTLAPLDPPVITVDEFVLSVTGTYASYQWIRNGTDIPFATNPTYTVTENAAYQVRVTDTDGCEATSTVYSVNNVSVAHRSGIGQDISIYPNPVNDVIYINSPVAVHAMLTSIEGRNLLREPDAKVIATGHLAKGIYLLHLSDKEGRLIKTVKVVKE